MSDSPLINLGDLAKPATVLIERVSDAVGGLFRPFQVRRVAQAQAEADLILARSQIEVGELQERAVARFFAEEAAKQSNMEAIVSEAIPRLEAESRPQDVDRDWITNFFDKCRIVSDEDMQRLWAAVLAAEANEPKSYSRKTVNLLADLDREDADMFTSLCRFCWRIGDTLVPLVLEYKSSMYTDNGVAFPVLSHLDSLGLVVFDGIAGFERTELEPRQVVHYHDMSLCLSLPYDGPVNSLELGNVMFSRAGAELAALCVHEPVEGFFDYVRERWSYLIEESGTDGMG